MTKPEKQTFLSVGMLVFFAGLILLLNKIVEKIAERPIEAKVVELHITRPDKGNKQKASPKSKIQTMPFGTGTCSGEFIDGNGGILTAKHCTQGATKIEILTNNNEHYEAEVISQSPIYDLALIRISRSNTPYFRLANTVTRGETVFALGSPLAITNTLSKGIVAKLDGDTTLVDLSVLPGNSGCPIFNLSGELVGVAVAGYIVGFGTTHLNLAQGLDSVKVFLNRDKR